MGVTRFARRGRDWLHAYVRASPDHLHHGVAEVRRAIREVSAWRLAFAMHEGNVSVVIATEAGDFVANADVFFPVTWYRDPVSDQPWAHVDTFLNDGQGTAVFL